MACSNEKTVMTTLSKPFWLSASFATIILSGCVGETHQESANVAHKHTANTPVATVKPGAALELSSRIDGALVAGTYTDIEVTISAAYDVGTLQATATGTDGLEVLSSLAHLSHDMATGPVVWRLAVRPNDDGLHYLNIMATVSGLTSAEPTARAFSIAIDPGSKSQAVKESTSAKILQSRSENLAIFEAQETMLPDQ